MTPLGCPIEDTATVPQYEKFVSEYYTARCVYEINKVQVLYEKALERLGLFDEPKLLTALEFAFIEIKNNSRDKELAKQKLLKR
jgi:hypothetical protein